MEYQKSLLCGDVAARLHLAKYSNEYENTRHHIGVLTQVFESHQGMAFCSWNFEISGAYRHPAVRQLCGLTASVETPIALSGDWPCLQF